MTHENWQSVTPQLEQFSSILENLTTISPSSFAQLQPRLMATLNRFTVIDHLTKALVINCSDNSIYRQLIKQMLEKQTQTKVILSESLGGPERKPPFCITGVNSTELCGVPTLCIIQCIRKQRAPVFERQ